MMQPIFDRSNLKIKPLAFRTHDIDLSVISPLKPKGALDSNRTLNSVAARIIDARSKGSSIIWMMGAHVIRSGVQNYIIDLMKRGYISCLALNGAGIIHDYEFAFFGATTESVAKYIQEGQFGLWKETGILNDIINQSYRENPEIGMGEAVGKAIAEGPYPYKDISILAAAYRCQIPTTVHVGIGYDIIHEHPNCDGAATGATSYVDFLRFAKVVQGLEKGVVMNFGSAVMAPEVFLKALSMARNVACQEGKVIADFATLVCDLHDLSGDWSKEPRKTDPAYYFRPWKTMLARTVADGGKSFYVKGRHADTIPALWENINREEKGLGHRT
jgi:hypothetical protein